MRVRVPPFAPICRNAFLVAYSALGLHCFPEQKPRQILKEIHFGSSARAPLHTLDAFLSYLHGIGISDPQSLRPAKCSRSYRFRRLLLDRARRHGCRRRITSSTGSVSGKTNLLAREQSSAHLEPGFLRAPGRVLSFFF